MQNVNQIRNCLSKRQNLGLPGCLHIKWVPRTFYYGKEALHPHIVLKTRISGVYFHASFTSWFEAGVQLCILSLVLLYNALIYSCGSQWSRGLRAWTVFARSNSGIMGTNPTRGMDVCVRLFYVCVVLYVGSGLATGWSPVQGVLPTVYRIKKLKKPTRSKGL
jgi:hypothetical protein